jgi:ribosome-associated protein
MDLRKLQTIVVTALEDIKARDIEVINTTKLTSLFDRMIIASADSTRQVKALARNVHDKVKEAGGEVLSIEGEETGEWVLVDLGTIVVHVMQPSVRSYYNLEELWQTKAKKSLPPNPLPEGGGDDDSLRSQTADGPRLGAPQGDSPRGAPRRRRISTKKDDGTS